MTDLSPLRINGVRRCNWCERPLRWNQISQCQRCSYADAMPCSQGANFEKGKEEGMIDLKSQNSMLGLWVIAIAVLLTLSLFISAWFVIPQLVVSALGLKVLDSMALPDTKSLEPTKVNGMTQQEWFDIVKAMGRKEYERLSRPALDGLEESTEGYGGWDARLVMGNDLYLQLIKEFYPERFCEYCQMLDCDEKCNTAYYAKVKALRYEREPSTGRALHSTQKNRTIYIDGYILNEWECNMERSHRRD